MQIKQFEKNSYEWLESRKKKITGTKLKDLIVKRGTGKKKGFYQLIADRLALPEQPNNFIPEGYDLPEDARARGHRLESEAIEKFKQIMPSLNINTTPVLCISEENENIAYSPDALVYENDEPIATVEVKCLDGANHIEALITQDYSDFEYQMIQGFIVNPKQKYAYLIFYNPTLSHKSLHYIYITRNDVREKITEIQEYQNLTLTEVEDWTNKIINDKI